MIPLFLFSLFGLIIAGKYDPLPEEELSIEDVDIITWNMATPAGMEASALKDSLDQKWPNGTVPYSLHPSITSAERRQITDAIREIEQKTCVRFEPALESDQHSVLIYKPLNPRKCSSFVGRQGNKQQVNLGSECYRRHLILHELMHVLGFIHEHNRADRDDHVIINWENIIPGTEKNFKKWPAVNLTLMDTPYSYNSIMHYSETLLSKDHFSPTIVSKKPGVKLGGDENLSPIDVLRINRYYKCGPGYEPNEEKEELAERIRKLELGKEVSAPPIPPPDEGKCIISKASGREICYPNYNELDTSCTDVTGQSSGLVAPPAVDHATVRAMEFVPPDNLRRLIMQYYRQHGKHVPKNATFSLKSFLFVKYHCDFGYEMVDEVDTLFCQNKEWVNTIPQCVGKGLCANNNGGCSHSCLSVDEERVECKCPRGMTLDADMKTCRKPIPKTLCRSLAGCNCSSIDDNQYTCTCPKGTPCLLLKGPSKIYVEPAGPYEVAPGGSINISCAAVAYPFPEIYWQRGNEEIPNLPGKTGTVKSDKILIIKELYKNTDFTCHANNSIDKVERTVHVVITGPGSAPILRAAQSGRTSINVRWEPPHIINRPITSYTIYYTHNGYLPINYWKKIEVMEPNREQEISDLKPNSAYFIRLRANDLLGPGRLGNPVSVTTLKPAVPPEMIIEQGEEIRVAPLTPFFLGCNVTQADPTPTVSWQHKGRQLSAAEKGARVTIQHGGLLENTFYTCIAENEAGSQEKSIQVVITGPSAPERIQYQVDGNAVKLQWEEPRITNGPMAGYDVLYSDGYRDLHPREYRIDNPNQKEARIDGLDEKKKYHFVIRGRNHLGTGLPTSPSEALTWLAPRTPSVSVEPSGVIEKAPSQNELSIECVARGVPRPKIIWLWSGQLVEDGKDEFRVYDTTPIDAQDLARSKLIAQSTTRTGSATCQAVNSEGSDEKKTEVKIKGPGSAPLAIHPVPMHTGFDVSWNPPKRPNGRIKNYIVYYTKNLDSPLSEWESQTVPADKQNLTVFVDDEETPYVVKVQATTDDGPGIISQSYEITTGKKQVPLAVRLEILDPQISPDGETEVEPAQPIHFRCITDGRPQPSVSYSWLPGNTSSDSRDEPMPLPIEPSSDQDHRYESIKVFSNTPTKRILLCQARNPDGSAEDRHVFVVNKPGSPPKDLNVIVDPDNRVTIEWQRPKYTNGHIMGYKVYITGDPTQPVDQWQIFSVGSDDLKFVLARGELEPDTPYYVKVSAVNPSGEGMPSDPTHFTAVNEAPLNAPADILPIVTEDNTVNISWAAPKNLYTL